METEINHKKPVNSELWEQLELDDFELARYLRRQSGDYAWSWKNMKNCNMFFSSKGRAIAVVFYTGPRKMEKQIFILRNRLA